MNEEAKEATNKMTKEKGNREVVSDVFSMLMQYPVYGKASIVSTMHALNPL